MPVSYEARFSRLGISFEEALPRLETVMAESRIFFDGEVMRLECHEGDPVPSTGASVAADTVAAAAKVAQKWWGLGLFCVSQTLMEALGRTDAIEVTFTLFRSPADEPLLIYTERGSAERARRETPALAADLCDLLVRLASAIRSDVAIYDEESSGPFAIPDLDEVEQRLALARESDAVPEICLAVSSHLMPLERAQGLAGRWADHVRATTNGYTVFALLGHC